MTPSSTDGIMFGGRMKGRPNAK